MPLSKTIVTFLAATVERKRGLICNQLAPRRDAMAEGPGRGELVVAGWTGGRVKEEPVRETDFQVMFTATRLLRPGPTS